MIKNSKGFSIIEIITGMSLFLLFVYISSSFIASIITNYIKIYKDLSVTNEIMFALNSIDENILISDELLHESGFNSDESNLSIGYDDEGIYKKVSYSLYQNQIRKKMANTTYLTTSDCNITGLKFYYSGNLVFYNLQTRYGNYLSNIKGAAVIPNNT